MTDQTTKEAPRIVVGVDGAQGSKTALVWAMAEARLAGTTVEAVTAWQDPVRTGYGFAYGWSAGSMDGGGMRVAAEKTQVIGSDLRMVEQVTGRLTWPRVLISGVVGGAWFGVFVGLLLNILTTASFGRAMSFGLTWGAIVPGRFEVLVSADHAEHARTILAGSPR